VRVLAILTLLVSAMDHWTTYLCLREPVEGWRVAEANPIAEALFESYGLVQGLVIDSAITLLAVGFLLTTRRLPDLAKGLFFAAVIAWTGFAVVNNLYAIQVMGLSPLGTV
jgi:cell division protein FtsW (lipid II flippase)